MKECRLFEEIIRINLHFFLHIGKTEIGILFHLIHKLINNFPGRYLTFIQGDQVDSDNASGTNGGTYN